MSDLILKPGDIPPTITPYCQRCDMPVERYCMDLADGTQRIGIHASCCGQTSSTRIDFSVYRRLMAEGGKLYVIVRKGSQAGIRSRKLSLRSISH